MGSDREFEGETTYLDEDTLVKIRRTRGRRLRILQNIQIPWAILIMLSVIVIDVFGPPLLSISYFILVISIWYYRYRKRKNTVYQSDLKAIIEENPDRVETAPTRPKPYKDEDLPWTDDP